MRFEELEARAIARSEAARQEIQAAREERQRVLLERLARATEPVNFAPIDIFRGAGRQPSQDALLRESLGWPAIAARKIAERISELDYRVSRRISLQETELLDAHPLEVLLDRGSLDPTSRPIHSGRAMRHLIAHYLVTVGEAYLLKILSTGQIAGRSIPVELQVLQPARCFPVVRGGRITEYRVTNAGGQEITFSTEEIVRVWYPDPETLYSAEGILGPMAIDADAQKFAGEHLRSRFQFDATPPTVVVGDREADSPDRKDELPVLEEMWRKKFNSRQGSHRGLPPWLPPGWDLKVLQTPGGQDLVPLLEYWRDMSLMGYGVPKSILGLVQSGDRSSAETNQFVFDLHTISPLTNLIGEAFTQQLAPDFDPSLMVHFEEFVSRDKEWMLRQEDQDLRQKVRSINQVREDRGLDVVPWGDDPVGTITDVPYDPGAMMEPQFEEESEDELRLRSDPAADVEWERVLARERTWVPLFQRQMRSVLETQAQAVAAALGDLFPRMARQGVDEMLQVLRDLFEPDQWRELFDAKVEPVRQRMFRATGAEALTQVGAGQEFVFTERAANLMRDQAMRFRADVNRTTRRRLEDRLRAEMAESIELGEALDVRAKRVQAAMRNEFVRRKKADARTIARTEVLEATQAAQLEGFEQAGVERKRWNTSRDARVRDSHEIDGQTRELDQPFQLADGEMAKAPGVGWESPLSAENRINCRCFVTPVVT